MELLETLERYAKAADDTQSHQSYLYWGPGSYSYLFVPTRQTLSTLANRIDGATCKRRVGSTALRTLSFVPQFCKLVPPLSRYEVLVPASNQYDFVIVGSHIKLLNFETQTVTTLKQNKDDFNKQIEFRRSLSDEINVPEIYSYNKQFPYYTEELISGREIVDPLKEWQYVEDALVQLRSLYERDREWYTMPKIIQEIHDGLANLNIQHDPVIQRALKVLKCLSLPEGIYKGTVHGDFHSGNLLVLDDVYILDWDRTKNTVLIADFFKIFDQYYEQTFRVDPYLHLISGKGSSWRIFNNYSKVMGESVYRSKKPFQGLPLLYLLYVLSKKDVRENIFNSRKYEIIERITAKLNGFRC